jgi:glycosyltransferase involved in cell wall biosynthesis
MKIAVYCYDHTGNPRCGGGGAYRTQIIHTLLSKKHTISMYFGYYRGATSVVDKNASVRFLGFGTRYLVSRISYSICATIHSLFSKNDVTVVEFSAFSPVLTFLFRPRKTVVQVHHLIGKEPLRKYSIFGIFPIAAEFLFLHFSRYVITSADSVAQYISKTYPRITAKATYNGIDQSIYSTEPIDNKFILTLGRLDIYMKGLDILLDSFDLIASSFPEYKLVLAGRGNEKDIDKISKRIERSPHKDRILLRINITLREKMELLHSATFGCMPSRFEGWNIVAIETAASSKATLGTDIMGLKDTIKNGETGLLVPPENVTALAEGMRQLLSDKKLRTILGQNGYRWAETFSWDTIAHNQEQFYIDILK